MQGLSLGQVIKRGYARSTARQILKRLMKAGKLPSGNGQKEKESVALTAKSTDRILPEWLATQVNEIYDSSLSQQKAFLAGISVPLMGLRLMAEAMVPFGRLMELWAKGQAEAARAVSGGGEQIAAETVNALMPSILGTIEKTALTRSPKPMESVMARMMENTMNKMMNLMMPSTNQPQGSGQQPLPPGWTDNRQ